MKNFLNGAGVRDVRRYVDSRGEFTVLHEASEAVAQGLPAEFVQDNHSVSRLANTIRGIHLQLPPFEQGKLVHVLRGRIVDVVVDLRPGSPTHGQHELIELGATDQQQIWIPRGFGHGFCTVEPDTEVLYKVDAPYRPDVEVALAWDDPTLNVAWPDDLGERQLSEKDSRGLTFAEVVSAIDGAPK